MPRQYHKNPRKISEKQADNLERDLVKYGDLSGIVHNLETDEVIGGNQRSKVMDFFRNNCEVVFTEQYDQPDEQGTVALGYVIWKGKKYTYRQVRWDAKTAEGANIVANKAGGTWDMDILTGSFEVDDLLEWGFEREELGLEDVLPSTLEDPGPQIDRAEELREKWQVESGQLWQLGEHRLICGDCTDAAVVERLMGGEKANGAFTSPPYAMQRKDTYGGVPTDEYVDWWEGVQAAVRSVLAEDGSFFVNIKPHCEDGERVLYVFDLVLAMQRRWGWKFFEEWCWKKNGVPGDFHDRPRNDFEPVYHFCLGNIHAYWDQAMVEGTVVKGSGSGSEMQGKGKSNLGKQVQYAGMVRPGNVISTTTPRLGEHTGHPAAFPEALLRTPLLLYSRVGDIWLEPFSGSGTTLIACEQLGRKCRAVEIAPGYVAVTLERWADMTGQTPELVTNG